MDDMSSPFPPPRKSGGCLKILGCGCLALVILLVAAGIGVYIYYPSIIAAIIEGVADSSLEQMNIPAEEREEAMQAIREFGDKIRNREVSLEQGQRVVEELFEGPLVPALLGQAFDANYLQSSGLSEGERESARATVRRFVHGVIQEQIPRSRSEQIQAMIMEEEPESNGTTTQGLKTLNDDEIRKVIQEMEQACDQAGVPADVPEVNIAAEIRKAIERGMQAKPDQADQPDPTE